MSAAFIACGGPAPTPDLVLDRRAAIEALEGEMLKLVQADVPLEEKFAPGVYYREVLMRADTIVIGHEHRTEHFNIVLTGRATVMIDGEIQEIVAPCTFVSKPGVRKMLRIWEDMRWATIHPTDETDLQKLEDLLIVKSDTYLARAADVQRLMEHSPALAERSAE